MTAYFVSAFNGRDYAVVVFLYSVTKDKEGSLGVIFVKYIKNLRSISRMRTVIKCQGDFVSVIFDFSVNRDLFV